MIDLLWRFLLGGLIVSACGVLADGSRSKTLSGLWIAAPSVAIATLALTIRQYGAAYAAIEARSLVIGAIALGVGAFVTWSLLFSRRAGVVRAALIGLAMWFATALGLGLVLLRPNG